MVSLLPTNARQTGFPNISIKQKKKNIYLPKSVSCVLWPWLNSRHCSSFLNQQVLTSPPSAWVCGGFMCLLALPVIIELAILSSCFPVTLLTQHAAWRGRAAPLGSVGVGQGTSCWSPELIWVDFLLCFKRFASPQVIHTSQ